MSDRLSPGVVARIATEAACHAVLSDAALAMLSGDTAPADYLDALTARELWTDAVRFLASALPKREAVWWSYLCAVEAYAGATPEPVQAALVSVRRWVIEPDEPNRRATEAAAIRAGAGSSAGCSALAAFWSGGSLGPDGLANAVPPPDHLTARGVTGAILLAAVWTDPARAVERMRRFLTLGGEVAAGKNRWESGPTKAPSTNSSVPPRPSGPAPRTSTRADRRPDTWE